MSKEVTPRERRKRKPRILKYCAQCGKEFRVYPSEANTQRCCSYSCARRFQPRPKIEERFWDKVDKNGPIPEHVPELGNCWVWAAPLGGGGYGLVRVRGTGSAAHRVSWEIHNGTIPKGPGYHGTCVLHKCDNRACVNPDRLFLGGHADNAADREAKGRGAQPCGEQNGRSKLTTSQVKEIRRLYAQVNRPTQQELAKMFGVHFTMISMIVRRKNWRHVA